MSRFMRGRRRTSAFLGVAIIALTFGVSIGLARSGPSQWRLKLYNDPGALCPVSEKGSSFGKADLKRSKGVVKVKVHLHGAAPGTYFVQLGLFTGLNCVLVSPPTIANFKVGSDGDGNGSGSFLLSDFQDFAVGAFSADANGGLGASYVTPVVTVGSS